MQRQLLTLLLLSLSMLSHAASGACEPTSCAWLGESASAMAQNQDTVSRNIT